MAGDHCLDAMPTLAASFASPPALPICAAACPPPATVPSKFEGLLRYRSPVPRKSREPTSGTKRKRGEDAEEQCETPCAIVSEEQRETKARIRDAVENLEQALRAAAPSATKVLEILEAEYSTVTLANAIARLAASANDEKQKKKARCCDSVCEGLRSQRVAKLWPSIQERLEKQMLFNEFQKDDAQVTQKDLPVSRVKLEVQMVPEEAPRQWLKEYETEGRIKQMVADTRSQLKFIATIPLGFGRIFNGLEHRELTFAYCKSSKKLLITDKPP